VGDNGLLGPLGEFATMGTFPTSFAFHEKRGLIYVANCGLKGNIAGFKVNKHQDDLEFLQGSQRPLGFAAAELATVPRLDDNSVTQIAFTPDGTRLIAAMARTPPILRLWRLDEGGFPISVANLDLGGRVPFGIEVTDDVVFVASTNAVFSVRLVNDNTIAPISSVDLSDASGLFRFKDTLYILQEESNAVSVVHIDEATATLSILQENVHVGLKPRELAVDEKGKFLYVLTGGGSIFSVGILADGRLAQAGWQTHEGLQPFSHAAGLAVF
jgi:DNA-binding beta-propeller fold protein YncE